MHILELIFYLIIMIPVYILLLYSFLYPEESLLWGNRWLFKQEPDMSDAAIKMAKVVSVFGLIIITVILLSQVHDFIKG